MTVQPLTKQRRKKRGAYDRISHAQRIQVIYLKTVHELPLKVIQDVVGIKYNTVRNLLRTFRKSGRTNIRVQRPSSRAKVHPSGVPTLNKINEDGNAGNLELEEVDGQDTHHTLDDESNQGSPSVPAKALIKQKATNKCGLALFSSDSESPEDRTFRLQPQTARTA